MFLCPAIPNRPEKKAKPKKEIIYANLDMADDDVSAEEDERIIYFTGEVSETNVSNAIAGLFSLARTNSKKPIYLVIETYGGYVDSMFALYDAIKFVPCPVHTIAMGKVMSAGVLLLASGEKGERLIAPHARVMTHMSHTHMSGNVFELKQELAEHERLEEMWVQAMTLETGRSYEEMLEMNNRHGDQYYTPEKCIELGIADKLMYDPKFKK